MVAWPLDSVGMAFTTVITVTFLERRSAGFVACHVLFAKTVYTVLRLPRLSRILLKPEKSGDCTRRLAKAVSGVKMPLSFGFSRVFQWVSGFSHTVEVTGSSPVPPTRRKSLPARDMRQELASDRKPLSVTVLSQSSPAPTF